MDPIVKFFVFAHGNIVRVGEEGVSYDRDPLRKIRLKTDATYKDLLNAICTCVKIDPTTHQIKLHHRYPKSVEGRLHYLLVPILDGNDVEDLIQTAEKTGEGSIQELYVEISDKSVSLSGHEMQQVDATMPSTSQVPLLKHDPTITSEDFMPKRPRYETPLSKGIYNTDGEINRVIEDPHVETGKSLVVADLKNEDPSQNLMIHYPKGFTMPHSPVSMDITNGMEEGNQTSRESLSTTPPIGHKYEVFLSFRGVDTRHGFTDHLYNGLVNVGVRVFRDNEELHVGEEIGPELLKAIKGSKILIPIISKNYASSIWCLKELVQILKCKETPNQVVLPIFYQVKPSEVRNQTGDFGKGFLLCKKKHDVEDGLVQEWKNALMEIITLKAWESNEIANGHEGELVKMVVHKVLQVLRKVALPISDHLVGVEDHMQKIIEWMTNSKKCNDVQAIVFHGMGGIGKTTLAKVVYNQLCNQFERCSFIANIHATSQQYKGLEELQKQLISNILGQQQGISNTDEGANIIKARCNRKKVLILLDDIDHRDQLDALAGKPDWFGRGTVIIITSRRKDVLQHWDSSFSYELNELDPNLSFLLFCKHAFKGGDSIPDEYNPIAKEIVSTTGGLPLAIQVIGSFLFGKAKNIWEGNLEILKEIPHHEVQCKLKISFDALQPEEKEIFLDIACHLIHEKKERAFYMWDSCGFCPQVRIEKLISLSLIKIEQKEECIVHDQLRDLGREIVRQESIHDPGKRSRIWKEKEAQEVLELKQGTPKVQAFNFAPFEAVHIMSEQFKGMTELKFLRLEDTWLEGDFENLFQNLKWLSLKYYWNSDDIMYMNFIPTRLVVLELFNTGITKDWMGWSHTKNLKVLKLQDCHHLTTTPDFSVMEKLEVLELTYCMALKEIH